MWLNSWIASKYWHKQRKFSFYFDELALKRTFFLASEGYVHSQYTIISITVQCDPATTCSGHGTCGPDGACECDNGFYMDDCSSKLKI